MNVSNSDNDGLPLSDVNIFVKVLSLLVSLEPNADLFCSALQFKPLLQNVEMKEEDTLDHIIEGNEQMSDDQPAQKTTMFEG